jgi:gamma-glutamyltranspeptidase/glutathione hydrolase
MRRRAWRICTSRSKRRSWRTRICTATWPIRASRRCPPAGLISKSYARERAALIHRGEANCAPAPGKPPATAGDTIYLSVVDRDGNIASLIQSVYLSFGSGVVVDEFGFHLQNRGALFELDPEHPNALAPRKRPLHTIIPAFMEKDNIHIGFGIMGGYNQAQAHAQFVSNLVDHNMNIQAALEAPRFTKLTFGGCDVMIENRVPAACAKRYRRAATIWKCWRFLRLDGRRPGRAARFRCAK